MSSTDNIDDLINLVQKARNLIANSHNELSEDKIVDLTNLVQRKVDMIRNPLNKTSTDDTGNVATIQSSQDDTSPKVMLIIHHQFPGIELTSPVYAGDGVERYLPPDQNVDVDSTMQTGFNINRSWRESFGILMYKLQRKNIDQSDKGNMSSEDETTYIQLVIVWKVSSFKEFLVDSYLIEHDKDRVWDRNRLMKLANLYRLRDIQHGPIEMTYLMHDNTVLMTSLSVTFEERYYKLDITISKTGRKYDTLRPEYFDVDR
jgi:hypothetical protein